MMLLIRGGRHAQRSLLSCLSVADQAIRSQTACSSSDAMPALRQICCAAMQAAHAAASPAQPASQPEWSLQGRLEPTLAGIRSRGFAKGAANAKRGAGSGLHCMTSTALWQLPDHACQGAKASTQVLGAFLMHACIKALSRACCREEQAGSPGAHTAGAAQAPCTGHARGLACGLRRGGAVRTLAESDHVTWTR
jgi:hypothetical protein